MDATLATVAAGHSNVVLLDWAALARGQPDWFTDGLHLTEAGKHAFAGEVRGAVLGPPAAPAA